MNQSMDTVTATEARVRFGELLDRVARLDSCVTVAKGGKPVAVVLSIESFRRLEEAAGGGWVQALEASQRAAAADLGGRLLPAAEEVLDEARRDRDGELSPLP
jgi:prevent-host-death family protein